MKIQNFQELASTPLRRDALQIVEAGLQGIDTGAVMRRSFRIEGDSVCFENKICSIQKTKRVFFVAIGKCAFEAAVAAEEILGDVLFGGIAFDVREAYPYRFSKIRPLSGTHPLPSEKNIFAAKKIIELVSGLTENDLVIFAISGGGSTLLCLPTAGGKAEDEAAITTALMRRGAAIVEINTVRKHISRARGGWLAKYAYPAQIITLLFSDVINGDESFIASGPTLRDETTVDDATCVLRKYKVIGSTAEAVCRLETCGLIETPKENIYFEKVSNTIVVQNENALEAMRMKAEELGYKIVSRAGELAGEASIMGGRILKELRSAPPKTALLYGGETSVVVRGHGRGGRNQELALSVLRDIRRGEVIVAVASDGRDNGPFGGAIADKELQEKASSEGIAIEPYLRENNEEPFYEKVGGYLMTGDTGSNVSDFAVALKE